ncbi:MAG: hypothetical protein EPN49_07295 [Rhodanobacter sp.]|nr:MAG: hypothetical protein EPN49_07295 [Rhodanobacter sp.]
MQPLILQPNFAMSKIELAVSMSSFHGAGQEASGKGGPPELLDQVRERRLGMVERNEEVSVGMIRRFIPGNDRRHPRDMGR